MPAERRTVFMHPYRLLRYLLHGGMYITTEVDYDRMTTTVSLKYKDGHTPQDDIINKS